MKTTALLLLCFVFTANFCSGQNLVPNPSFEMGGCPTGVGQLDSAYGWTTIRGTPEYFNRCADTLPWLGICRIPQSDFGHQYPPSHECVGYAGLFTFITNNPNAREMFGCALNSTLVVGQKYFVSFKVSLSDEAIYGSNNIGVLFKTAHFVQSAFSPNPNRAHLKSDAILSDTSGWVTLFGSFVADSSYGYFPPLLVFSVHII